MIEPKTCNKDHIGIQWTASGGCPLCPSHARIAELEREVLKWQEAAGLTDGAPDSMIDKYEPYGEE